MKYQDIFKKVHGGDLISVSTFSVENVLKKFPRYVDFCNDKVALRKELEREYKSQFTGNSMRVFLEHMVHAITNKKSLFTTFEACFGTESAVINKKSKTGLKTC